MGREQGTWLGPSTASVSSRRLGMPGSLQTGSLHLPLQVLVGSGPVGFKHMGKRSPGWAFWQPGFARRVFGSVEPLQGKGTRTGVTRFRRFAFSLPRLHQPVCLACGSREQT